jgi:MFS family permease
MNDASKSQSAVYASLLLFAVSAAFLFYKYILQVSPVVMTDQLMQAFSLTGTSLGFLVGFYFYTYMLMQIPSGILLDRWGVKRIMGLALLICALGAWLLSTTQSFSLACLARLLMGFGAAFATTSYMKVSSGYFPARYFPLFMGLFGTACMSGAGSAGLPLSLLVHRIGWRHTLLLCALVGVGLWMLFLLVMRVVERQRIQHDAAPSMQQGFKLQDIGRMLKNRMNILLILYGGFAFIPVTVFGGLWGVPFLVSARALSQEAAASAVSLIFVGFALGGLLIALVASRFEIPRRRMMLMGTGLAALSLAVVIYWPHLSMWPVEILLFLFGLGTSGFVQSYTLVKELNPSALVATVIGIFNMGEPLCGAVADPLVGKLLDLHWQGQMQAGARVYSAHAYHVGLSVLMVYLGLALLCACFVKERTA